MRIRALQQRSHKAKGGHLNRYRAPIITIDGPAGAGKSSSARALAERIGLGYLDSGALYRAVAWKMRDRKIDLACQADVEAACAGLQVTWSEAGVCVDGALASERLRDPEVTFASAVVAAYPGVRRVLIGTQREMAWRGVVAEGRDIGTVVFPDADVKFYLDAAPEVRAARRAKEMHRTDTDTLLREIMARDDRDRHRTVAPLLPAADAIVIDSTPLTLSDVIDRMMAEIGERGLLDRIR